MCVSNDDSIAFLLINTWSLATGRQLRSDVPPGKLAESELIDFWADDHLWPAPPCDDQRDDRRAVPANGPGNRS